MWVPKGVGVSRRSRPSSRMREPGLLPVPELPPAGMGPPSTFRFSPVTIPTFLGSVVRDFGSADFMGKVPGFALFASTWKAPFFPYATDSKTENGRWAQELIFAIHLRDSWLIGPESSSFGLCQSR